MANSKCTTNPLLWMPMTSAPAAIPPAAALSVVNALIRYFLVSAKDPVLTEQCSTIFPPKTAATPLSLVLSLVDRSLKTDCGCTVRLSLHWIQPNGPQLLQVLPQFLYNVDFLRRQTNTMPITGWIIVHSINSVCMPAGTMRIHAHKEHLVRLTARLVNSIVLLTPLRVPIL